MPTLLVVGAALLAGIAIGYVARYWHAISQSSSLELDIKQKSLQAEEKALKIIEKAEEKAAATEKETKAACRALEDKLEQKENRLNKKEELLDQRQIDIDSQIESVRGKIEEVKNIKSQLDNRKHELDQKLEEVAGLTREEAFARMLETLEKERQNDLIGRIRKLEKSGDEQYEERARDLLLSAIHRVGNSMPGNVMTASVELPSDDLKGKIIGKEGRNVRAFERLTGVDVLIDDTPGYIVLSSFDPIRREIARVALELLLKDGRIQPAKIEELVE